MNDKEILLSVREGIKAKYGYTDEQTNAYCQGLADSFKEYDKIIDSKDVIKRADAILLCLSNVYCTGHVMQDSDYEFIERQCKKIIARFKERTE